MTSEAQQEHRTEMAGSNGKAEAASYKPVLSAEQQVITTTLKCAISQHYQSPDKKQLGFYQIKCWDCFRRAYRNCKEQRWSLYSKFFLIQQITENLGGFNSNLY